MAKKHKKKNRSGLRFAIGMMVYAVVFFTATFFGLRWFWGFIEAYELSRPQIAIDAYMDQLSKEHIVDSSMDVAALADANLQSREECREILMEALEEDITYARKASACTEDKQVFVLRSGKQVVGSFEIVTGEPDEYGFKPWHFSAESFDMNFLMGTETVTITVPEGYPVYVNGVELDESYRIGQTAEQFPELKDYYEKYDLPMFVLNTYQAGPFLNRDYVIEAKDPQGNPFIYDESFDKYQVIHNCSSDEEAQLKAFLEKFLHVYVIFAGCANDAPLANYDNVMKYVVSGSNLQSRMEQALEGMQFSQSRGDSVAGFDVHHYVRLSEGVYLCDVTYKVDTLGREGVVQTSTSTRILIVRSGTKLLVDSMMDY